MLPQKKIMKNENESVRRRRLVIIEHNLDIIRRADWIIDLGPEGGKNGGEILFEGTPEDLKSCNSSITARYI